MSSSPYIDGSTLDECREAYRQGIPLAVLAGKLQCSEDHLRQLLGLPTWTPEPQASDACDLWRADALDGQL